MVELYNKLKKDIMSNVLMMFAFVVVICLLLIAIFAPYIAPYDPLMQDYSAMLQKPSINHIFGTDALGRDILSRVIYGSRISLMISIVSVLIGMSAGVSLGFVAGYMKGAVDFWTQRFIDFLLSFPGILLAILISVITGAGLLPVILAISIWSIPTFCRITRGMVMSVSEKEYVLAAEAAGANMFRIMIIHILRNISGPLLVYATLRIGSAILTTAYLSFLGVGVSPPTPEWGLLVNQGKEYILEASYFIFFPGLAIFITVLSFNILGDGLRDIFDVKSYN